MKYLGSRNGFHRIVASLSMAAALMLSPTLATAQDAPAATVATTAEAPAAAAPAADAAADAAAAPADAPAAGSYTPMKPTEGKGMPIDRAFDVQKQYSPTGEFANSLHVGLVWVMAIISAFVLLLFIIVIVRFNAKANPVPSKTSHNTLIEVIWTVVPALILLGIAIPSISLLAKQYQSPPKDAITIKAIGYQWYWGYAYPDNGDFEVVSNMLKEKGEVKAGERFRTDNDGPSHLAVDNRMVVPAGVPIRLQVTAADVIHSFAVPSLWFKLDAVPGRINEKLLFIKEPGVYFGQCSELCGARHGYMPIAVEALPLDKYNQWVLAQGGTIKGAEAPAAAPAPAAAAPAAAATDAPAEPAPAA